MPIENMDRDAFIQDIVSEVNRRSASDISIVKASVDGQEKVLIDSATRVAKIREQLDKESSLRLIELDKKRREKEYEEHKKLRKRMNEEELREDEEKWKNIISRRRRTNDRYRKEEEKAQKRLYDISQQYEDNLLKHKSVEERKQHMQRKLDALELYKQQLEQEHSMSMAVAKTASERKKLNAEYFAQMKDIEEAQKTYNEKREQIERIIFKLATSDEKKSILESQKKLVQEKLRELDLQHKLQEEQGETAEEYNDYLTKRGELTDELINKTKDYNAILDDERKHAQQISDIESRTRAEIEKRGKALSAIQKAQKTAESAKQKYTSAVDRETKLKTEREDRLSRATTDTERDAIKAEYDQRIKDAEAETNQARSESIKSDIMLSALNAAVSAVNHMASAVMDAVSSSIDMIKNYQAPIMARLQGADTDYYDAMKLLKKNLAVSPYVSYKQVLENLSKLVDTGIAYNIEERAFLSTISDKIATTFDAFDANLLRLIRIQQADTTAARLGMEASLTQFFNKMFSDTTYLKDMYDTVSGAILDANAMLTYQESTAFEYILQKWLGSLYSMGFSQTAVSQIAEGVNLLATGNVQGLAGNTAMQTLLNLAATRTSTVDFASAIKNGLNDSELNDLMRGMVEYLQDTLATTDTRAVRAAYGDIFNMSMADFAAIQHLTSSDIENIYSSTMTYQRSLQELQTQFNQVSKRLSLTEMASNVFSNAMFSVAEGIAENPALYVTWAITDTIEKATGGIHLPSVMVLGSGVDLSAFTVEGIMKGGLVGASTLAMIPSIVSSIQNKGGLGGNIFDTWNASETLTRGTGVDLTPTRRGTSEVRYVGSGNQGDIRKSSIREAAEGAQEVQDITNPNASKEKTFQDLWNALYVEKKPLHIADVTSTAQVDSTESKNTANLNKLLTAYVENGAIDVNVVNEVEANVTDMDSGVANMLKGLFTAISLPSLFGGGNKSSTDEDDEDGYSLKDLIMRIMNGKVDVNVTNSNFDNFISRTPNTF